MKYAIISDIHGNIHAFKAVLSDAKKQGADMYLLIGDYFNSFPWGNEVADVIRSLGQATVIRGNGENYHINLKNSNHNDWGNDQFKPIYWAYRSLSKENLEYITSLPETATVADNGGIINLRHSLEIFFRSPKIEYFHSTEFRALMSKKPFTHEEYLFLAREALLSRPDAFMEIEALPEGAYLFGHNHLQFHMEYKGRIFINPGSCGEALDWNTTASYTLLEYINNSWNITERRVKYDLNTVAEGLHSSGYAAYAPVWSKVMELELFTAKDYFYSFVLHIEKTRRKYNKTGHTAAEKDIWEAAVNSWDINTIITELI